jgi:hypothetical protein
VRVVQTFNVNIGTVERWHRSLCGYLGLRELYAFGLTVRIYSMKSDLFHLSFRAQLMAVPTPFHGKSEASHCVDESDSFFTQY